MRLASHGPNCGAKTTIWHRCRACKERMFFFRCRHGCRVGFAGLGTPWNKKHVCRQRRLF